MAFSYFATYTYYRELKGQLVTEKEFASTGRSFSCPIREKYLDDLKEFVLQSLSRILREFCEQKLTLWSVLSDVFKYVFKYCWKRELLLSFPASYTQGQDSVFEGKIDGNKRKHERERKKGKNTSSQLAVHPQSVCGVKEFHASSSSVRGIKKFHAASSASLFDSFLYLSCERKNIACGLLSANCTHPFVAAWLPSAPSFFSFFLCW